MDILIFFGGLIVLVLILRMINVSRYKKRVTQFLKENDEYAKLYISSTGKGKGRYVGIEKIDGKKPVLELSGIESIYYVSPGKHVVSFVSNQASPNPFRKDGPLIKEEISIEVEGGFSYNVVYDFKDQQYSIQKKETI